MTSANSERSSVSELRKSGKRIGPFEVGDMLGRGGMGEVKQCAPEATSDGKRNHQTGCNQNDHSEQQAEPMATSNQMVSAGIAPRAHRTFPGGH